jgi:hypothetical protein
VRAPTGSRTRDYALARRRVATNTLGASRVAGRTCPGMMSLCRRLPISFEPPRRGAPGGSELPRHSRLFQLSEMRESNPRLLFVGERPSHWTNLGSYRRRVPPSRDRPYEWQLRAGAAGLVPERGVEPPGPSFVAMGAFHTPRALRPRRDSNPCLLFEGERSSAVWTTGTGGSAYGCRARLAALKGRRPRRRSNAPYAHRAIALRGECG